MGVNEPPVKRERSGWRDSLISEEHRRWGWNLPAVDLDFLMIEYDSGRTVAIVEYKNESAPVQYASHPSYQALIDLGNRATCPVFAVRYARNLSWWRVVPLNECAKHWLNKSQTMSRLQWVEFNYKIRGRDIPKTLFMDTDVEV